MRVHAVLRVSASKEQKQSLSSIGNDLNGVWANIYTGLRKRSESPAFDGDIAKGLTWEETCSRIEDLCQKLLPFSARLSGIDAKVTVDVAIWLSPSEHTQLYSLVFNSSLQQALSQLSDSTEVSIYLDPVAQANEDGEV